MMGHWTGEQAREEEDEEEEEEEREDGTHNRMSCWFFWKTPAMCWKISGVNR